MPKQTTISLFLASVFLFIATPLFAGEFQDTTGDLTLTTNTVVNGAKWIRGGNLTIGAGVTLQVNANATLSFETGRRITNNKGGATILVSRSGGRIIKAAVICTNVFCYRDNDGDSWGTGSAVIFCNSCPAGYTSQTGDCCDIDSATYPGYAGYGTSPNRCGSWDRDCNGIIWKNNWMCYSCTNCQGVNYKQTWWTGPLYERCDCTAAISMECGQSLYECTGQAECLGCGSPIDRSTGWGGCYEVKTCFPTPGYACLGLPCYRGTTCNRAIRGQCGCK